jgi:hypothetical protein
MPIKTRQWLSKIHKNLGYPSINKYQFFCTNWNLLIKLLRVPETSDAAPVSSKSSRKLQSGVLVGAPGIQ